MAKPIKGAPVICAYGTKGPQWMSGWHQGIDFGAKIGTPVHAVADGVVIGVGIWGPSFGQYAPVVKHGKWYVVYGHVSAVYVKIGDKVKLGQHIADVGREGMKRNDPHLHLEAQPTQFWQIGGSKNPKNLISYTGKNPLTKLIKKIGGK